MHRNTVNLDISSKRAEARHAVQVDYGRNGEEGERGLQPRDRAGIMIDGTGKLKYQITNDEKYTFKGGYMR
jgi:hypothetical protein